MTAAFWKDYFEDNFDGRAYRRLSSQQKKQFQQMIESAFLAMQPQEVQDQITGIRRPDCIDITNYQVISVEPDHDADRTLSGQRCIQSEIGRDETRARS